MKKTLSFGLCGLMILIFTVGCAKSAGGQTLRYDIPGPVANLDPQFATDPVSVMIISNIYEGLLVENPDAELLPGVALSHEVSGDGLTYTFWLREGAQWDDNDTPVTSGDFVFAFRRIFNPGGPSPYAKYFSAISGATAAMEGLAPASGIGVIAEDDYTLVITLERPDPLFLRKLSMSAAMPCNGEFFDECRGRYGLEEKFVRGNGPFALSRWDNEKYILLEQSRGYVSEASALTGAVNLYIGRTDARERFLNGETDAIVMDYSKYDALKNVGATITVFNKMTWCVIFNQKDSVWGSPLLRQALSRTIDRDALSERLPDSYTSAFQIVPPALLFDGKPFKSDILPVKSDIAQGLALYEMGLTSLDLDRLPPTTLYVPEGGHELYMGFLQQEWHRNLSAYLSVQAVSMATLNSKLETGDYQLALAPVAPRDSRLDSLFDTFSSSSPFNICGYKNPVYDSVLDLARTEASPKSALNRYSQAQAMLISDAVAVPVYTEASCFASASGVEGLWFSPYNGIYFKYAKK